MKRQQTINSKASNSQTIKQQNINFKLKKAIEKGDINLLKTALEEGASLDKLEGDMHATHFAASKDKVEILKYLVEVKKVDLSIRCGNGLMAIHVAARDGSLQALQYLIGEGCKIMEKDSWEWTPFHHAASRGRLEIVQFFVKCKIDTEVKSNTGWTPLHCAASVGHPQIVEFLIKHNANIEAEDKFGMTPISFAAAEGNVEAMKILIKTSASIEAKQASESKRSPLHNSVEHKKFEATKCLIESGANVDAQDIYGESPLSSAIKQRDIKTVKYLFENGAEYVPNLGRQYDYSLINYIKFGSFLQNLCKSEDSPFVDGIEKVIKAIFKSASNSELWTKFAISTLQSYALKKSMPVSCLEKIETCDILPANFKALLLENIRPLYEGAKESLEGLDAELLFLNNQTSDLVPCSVIEELSSCDETLKESAKFYEKFPQYKIPGTYILELAGTQFTSKLSLLSGLIMSVPTIRDGLELLLKLCIPAKVREVLTQSFQECKSVKLTEAEFKYLPKKAQEIALDYAEFYVQNAIDASGLIEVLGNLNVTSD